MSLFITSLNSGSNGNCYYIGNNTEAVLIDAGLSCRETEKRMQQLNLSMDKVKAIFISHEHADHIKGLAGLVQKHALPYYITAGTFKRSGLVMKMEPLLFTAYEPVSIGAISVTAFPKFHDAADPHSFIINCHGLTVGVFTDIGVACKGLVHYFSQCHAAFLEANYDDDMLANGSYPLFLKNRIRGGEGHLSNKQALEIFNTHRPKFMTHLLLAHLSKNNNDPQKVHQLFSEKAGGIKVVIASRYEQTALYTIQSATSYSVTKSNRKTLVPTKQLSLF